LVFISLFNIEYRRSFFPFTVYSASSKVNRAEASTNV